MHATVRAVLAAALLALPGAWGSGSPAPEAQGPAVSRLADDVALADIEPRAPADHGSAREEVPGAQPTPPMAGPCGSRALPVEGPMAGRPQCLALPDTHGPVRSARSRRLATRPRDLGAAQLRTGTQTVGLLPDRPPQWALYELPVETDYPIRQADTTAEGWTAPRGEGHEGSGVLIETTEDAPVVLLELEDQTGPADVVLVGPLRGITVVTRHRVESAAGERVYLLIHGMLSRPGPSVVSGARLEPGAILGFVGDDEGTRLPELYFEVRQVRGSSVATPRQLSELVSASASMPYDPRNVLSLR